MALSFVSLSPCLKERANDVVAADTCAVNLACSSRAFFATSPWILICSNVLPMSRAKSVSSNSRRMRGNCVLRYLWKRVAASMNSCSSIDSSPAIREKKGQSGLFGPCESFSNGAPYDTSFLMILCMVSVGIVVSISSPSSSLLLV